MGRSSLPTGTTVELALPEGEATRGLVLWPDILGLRPLFDGHAHRLATEVGWAVCVVEVFPGQEDLSVEQRLESAGGLRDVDKRADAVAAADLLGRHTSGPIGLLGFCMGGMYVMKSLPTGRFDRAVAFYGMVRMPDAWRGPNQADALESVDQRGDSKLLCIFGTEDPWCPLAEIDEVEAAGAEVVRYPGADHGWAQDPDRPNYRPDDAADAWARAIRFLSGGA